MLKQLKHSSTAQQQTWAGKNIKEQSKATPNEVWLLLLLFAPLFKTSPSSSSTSPTSPPDCQFVATFSVTNVEAVRKGHLTHLTHCKWSPSDGPVQLKRWFCLCLCLCFVLSSLLELARSRLARTINLNGAVVALLLLSTLLYSLLLVLLRPCQVWPLVWWWWWW